MRSFFTHLKRGLRNFTEKPFPELKADRPAVYIGDIHGSAEKLQQLLTQLTSALPDFATYTVVFLGDVIDRGEQSKQAVEIVRDLQRTHPSAICLKGNHEEFLQSFLENANLSAASWFATGGLQTLASYGVAPPTLQDRNAGYPLTRAALLSALGEPTLNWLRTLPMFHQNGNLIATHAAADPKLPMSVQNPQSLIWGHPDFGRIRRRDGLWVIHGHTIVDMPQQSTSGTISLDTGAFATAKLSAAIVAPENPTVRFITT
jgi:serine/threonine protein phosphatase 1